MCYVGLAAFSPCTAKATDMPDPTATRRIHASCHCGNVRVTFDWPDSRTGHSGPCLRLRLVHQAQGSLDLASSMAASSCGSPTTPSVAQYRFGTKTADFHVCLTCGVIPIVTCSIEGTRYAVVNVNTFDDVDRSQLVEAAANFEGETTENRLARRRRNWTPEAAGREGGAV